MLKTVLNVQQELTPNWHLAYGISSDRERTLLAAYPERNSFKHPDSETALTVFMFGNMDGWKQLGSAQCPRNQKGDWNRLFFDALRSMDGSPEFRQVARWSRLEHGLFQDATLNWPKAVLMFEFEIMNSKFHSVQGEPFKHLSFLDIGKNTKWGAFDAFMVVPSRDQTGQRKGVLIGFEAKLKSDISRHTKTFPYVNQVMRNLEAGYWLTHEPDSLYRNWEFHYVFVCPRLEFEKKTTLYSWMLFDANAKEQAAAMYREVLQHHARNVDPQHFQSFCQMVRDRATVLHWDQLAVALRQDNESFWRVYLDKLREQTECAEVLGATLQRLKSAGIPLP